MNLRLRFRRLEPKVLGLLQGPLWDRFKPWIDQHDVFAFTREPLARGVAIGLFCSLIPGPFQVISTIVLCMWWRGNLIAGSVATFISNPLTIVPLYALAFQIGRFILPGHYPMPSMQTLDFNLGHLWQNLLDWLQALGWPLVVGLPVLGLAAGFIGYGLIQCLWLGPVIKRAHKMRLRKSLKN